MARLAVCVGSVKNEVYVRQDGLLDSWSVPLSQVAADWKMAGNRFAYKNGTALY
jgi:hypothetical protein